MKICLISRLFSLEHNAGIGRLSVEVLEGLRARGHQVTTMCDKEYSMKSYLKYTALDIRRNLPKGQDVYCALGPLEGAYLPQQRAVTVFLDLIPITNGKQAGAGQNRNLINKVLVPQYFRYMANRSSKNAKLVAISEQTKQDVIKCFGVDAKKITVINPGVRQDLTPIAKTNRLGFKIGYLGQLDHRKRVDVLIQAFIDSKCKGQLWIAGTGVDELKLKQMAMHSPNIVFNGFVPDCDLSHWFSKIDVLVHPSACEGWGLTPVEAMACKKPVILLEDSYIPSEVKSRCLVSNNLQETLSIAHMMRFKNQDLNYQWAKSLTWSKFVDGLEKVLESVAN